MAESNIPDHRVYGQGRFHLEDLAIIAQWLEATGIRIRSRSDLLFTATNALAALIEHTAGVRRPETKEDALKILRAHGITWPFDDSKSGRAARRALQIDALTNDFTMTATSPADPGPAPSRPPTPPDVDVDVEAVRRQIMEHMKKKEHGNT